MAETNDDAFTRKLTQIEQSGRTRFGEANWNTMLEELRRSNPNGIPLDQMQQVAASPDPDGLLFNAGRHALMDRATSGDADAERAYRALRDGEREQWRKTHGRR